MWVEQIPGYEGLRMHCSSPSGKIHIALNHTGCSLWARLPAPLSTNHQSLSLLWLLYIDERLNVIGWFQFPHHQVSHVPIQTSEYMGERRRPKPVQLLGFVVPQHLTHRRGAGTFSSSTLGELQRFWEPTTAELLYPWDLYFPNSWDLKFSNTWNSYCVAGTCSSPTVDELQHCWDLYFPKS